MSTAFKTGTGGRHKPERMMAKCKQIPRLLGHPSPHHLHENQRSAVIQPGTLHKGDAAHGTRAALVPAATVIGLVLPSLLIVFILRNQEQVQVQYLGFVGWLPLGMALFIAAVAGGFLVANRRCRTYYSAANHGLSCNGPLGCKAASQGTDSAVQTLAPLKEVSMYPSRRVMAIASIAALMTMTTACEAPDSASNKAMYLTVATATGAGQPGAAHLAEFVRQVKRVSGDGSIRIDTQLRAAGDETEAWNQAVLELVQAGDIDMALIPTRTWEGEGVTSLSALSAPFLVTNDEVLKQVVAPGFADPMLAGLTPLGLTGLALLPEGHRLLFSFGEPIETPGDLNGKVVRAPRSAATDEVLRSFGAVPKPLPGSLFTQALAENAVGATETSFARAGGLTKPTTVTGNLVLYPKINTLVVNQDRWNGLTASERRVLEQAADATRAWATESMPATAAEAAAYCHAGGTIFTAPVEGIAAFKAAVAPMIARLETDPETKALIAKIRSLNASTPIPAPLTPCGPGG